jgi:hypothetical protein
MPRRYDTIVDNPVVKKILAAVTSAINAEAPEVVVHQDGRIQCPHCNVFDNFAELDYDLRENTAYVEHDRSEGSRVFMRISQNDGEYTTVLYFCTACNRIVHVPQHEVEVFWS